MDPTEIDSSEIPQIPLKSYESAGPEAPSSLTSPFETPRDGYVLPSSTWAAQRLPPASPGSHKTKSRAGRVLHRDNSLKESKVGAGTTEKQQPLHIFVVAMLIMSDLGQYLALRARSLERFC